MPSWIEIPVIVIAVTVATFYLIRRNSSSIKKKDSLDCPFAEECNGCSCEAPEYREKCGHPEDGPSCGCG